MTDQNPNTKAKFEDMFHLYKNHIYDYAVKMLGQRDTAADITQDVFIRFYNQLQNDQDIKSPKNWLFIICRNLCLNHLRNRKDEIPIEQAEFITSDESVSDKNNIIAVRKALNSIKVNYREAIILKEYRGFSYDEISDIMNITVPAVRSILYKARISLKDNYAAILAGRE